jgi:hypothetical protein
MSGSVLLARQAGNHGAITLSPPTAGRRMPSGDPTKPFAPARQLSTG